MGTLIANEDYNPLYKRGCEECVKARKSLEEKIEDLMLYANQLYKLGLKQYIDECRQQRLNSDPPVKMSYKFEI